MLTDKQQQIVDAGIVINRHRFSWTMNEINRLYNEYEIKELSIRQIAKLHHRSYKAILFQLSKEGLILPDWTDARGNYEMTD
jgi:predicted transcriptional regulator